MPDRRLPAAAGASPRFHDQGPETSRSEGGMFPMSDTAQELKMVRLLIAVRSGQRGGDESGAGETQAVQGGAEVQSCRRKGQTARHMDGTGVWCPAAWVQVARQRGSEQISVSWDERVTQMRTAGASRGAEQAT
eukprot:1714375-Rhodomonas_salina.2